MNYIWSKHFAELLFTPKKPKKKIFQLRVGGKDKTEPA